MSWIAPVFLAEIHRETYVAILKSWIPHGKKGEFARRAGISQEFLSYLCALDSPNEGKYPTKRLPSPQKAKEIAAALPAPAEIRRSLIENMELAHVNASKAFYVTQEFVSQKRVNELLSDLEVAHRQATFGTDLREVRRAYRTVRDAAANLLPNLSLDIYPASLAQTCMYLHDAQCVLDRPDDALRYARLARLVLQSTQIFEPEFSREEVDYLEINAIRGVGVAYHNLGLDKRASYHYEETYETPAFRNDRDFWAPLVGRDILNAMVQIPRFSIRRAEKLAYEIIGLCEQKEDEFTLMLTRESWLRCLIQREKWKAALKVYREEIERIPHLPYVGSLHRALLLKSGAHLAWQLGDTTTWRERLRDALVLMHQAGLKHQMRQVLNLYHSALNPVMEELDLSRNYSLKG